MAQQDDLLNALARALSARTATTPGAGSGIPRPAELDSTDAAVVRDARARYVAQLTDQPMTRLSAEEKATIRQEIDAVLKDSGFGS
jgi:hypothetical protein